MATEVRPLLFKPHMLKGLSHKLLISHYENNYGGALRRLNAIDTRLRRSIGPPHRCSTSTASSGRN